MSRDPAKSRPVEAWVVVTLLGVVFTLTLAVTNRRSGPEAGSIVLTLVGDVMLGRGVGPVVEADPGGIFAGVRWIISGSDLAVGNLESPFSHREHISPNPNVLVADPTAVDLIADAGFDVVSLANNHAGDAGPGSIVDTITAVEAAGIQTVGAGRDRASAQSHALVNVNGVKVALVAFDVTGAGLPAGSGPGVVHWDPVLAQAAVTRAAGMAEVVVVGIHGGVEYLPEPDPRMSRIAAQLVDWGADVVWGHGSHVVQPVKTVPADEGRRAVVATSLGNFIFDQRGPLTGRGAILQVMVDGEGVIAHRIGDTDHSRLRVRFLGWKPPAGDAVLVDGEWWELFDDPGSLPSGPAEVSGFSWGTVIAASAGRITSDRLEVAVSFRAIPGSHPVREGMPDVEWADSQGRTAHLGLYVAEDMTPIWVAGVVPAPIAALTACDGSLAFAYSGLDDPTVVATGAAEWRSAGLVASDRLPGPGTPECLDVDGDGRTEPVVRRLR